MPDTRGTGLFHKYDVNRRDGGDDPGGKHHGDWLFVLDIAHDWHAREALARYAQSCRFEYPELSEDLRKQLNAVPFQGRRWFEKAPQ